MTGTSLAGTSSASPGSGLWTAVSAVFVLVLTMVHHIYGAAVYDTPWRLHIVFIALPAAVLVIALFYLRHSHASRRLRRIAHGCGVALVIAFPVLAIGLYEGGYNHLLKNVLYFSGIDTALLRKLFPAPLYELPNDLIFEITGIAQFFAALVAAWYVAGLTARGDGRRL